MFVFAFALGLMTGPCSMTLGIAADGSVYSNRFAGWYKVSARTIAGDLRGGCYNDANPVPVSSVEVAVDPKAPQAKVAMIEAILKDAGWPPTKISVVRWSDAPLVPR